MGTPGGNSEPLCSRAAPRAVALQIGTPVICVSVATRGAWLTRIALCCAALGGCGESDERDRPVDANARGRNVVVKTLSPGACLPRPLIVEDDGQHVVSVLEVVYGTCDCTRPGRAPSRSDEFAAVREELVVSELCGGSTKIACSDYCACNILELGGSSSDPASPVYACQNQITVTDASLVGYCYIAPYRVDENGMPAPLGNPALVADCDPTERQTIRFVGADTPLPGAHAFVAAGSAPAP